MLGWCCVVALRPIRCGGLRSVVVTTATAAARMMTTIPPASPPLARARAEFVVPASCIQPLGSPAEFYEELLAGCRKAERRVTLASLYLGTGKLEQELVRDLASRIATLRGSPHSLDVCIQLDMCRSLRHVRHNGTDTATPLDGYSSSAHLLLELLQPRDGSVSVGMTLMPALRGLLSSVLPARLIEGAGVFHLKAYAFDDDVILTGANLSSDYFQHRQDRYVVVRGASAFAGYIHTLVRDIQRLPGSHVLRADGSVEYWAEQGSSSSSA